MVLIGGCGNFFNSKNRKFAKSKIILNLALTAVRFFENLFVKMKEKHGYGSFI